MLENWIIWIMEDLLVFYTNHYELICPIDKCEKKKKKSMVDFNPLNIVCQREKSGRLTFVICSSRMRFYVISLIEIEWF